MNSASARRVSDRVARLTFGSFLAVIVWPAAEIHAATIHVPADRPTITAGIAAASDGDTVEVAPGLYSGLSVVELNLDGKDIVLRSTEGSSATVLDCQDLGRAFHFGTRVPPTARVIGFTIRNGYDVARGGGVLIEGGAGPTFEDCRFEDCHAGGYSVDDGKGGAIHLGSGASARFVDCVLLRGACDTRYALGGGVYVGVDAHARFELCVIEECVAGFPPSTGYGGAGYIDVGGRLEFLSCAFSQNRARQGDPHYSTGLEGTIGGAANSTLLMDDCDVSLGSGGIRTHEGSTVVIAHTTFHQVPDPITIDGGELYLIDSEILGCSSVFPQVRILNGTGWISSCRVLGNQARIYDGPPDEYGGAIESEYSQVHIATSIIAGNMSAFGAAALWIKHSGVVVDQCTITGNRSDATGSAAIDCDASTVSIARSIVWDNCSSSIVVQNGSTVSLECCDVDPDLLAPSVGITADVECFSVDPSFCRGFSCASAPLDGGNYSLTIGSPCRPLETPCGVLVGALDYACATSDIGGACCLDDGSCTVAYAEECSGTGMTFQGNGSDCDPNPCIGGCCLDDGTCLLLTPTQCTSQSGNFTAYGYACEAIVCVPPGACCRPDGSCAVLPEIDCVENVGAYLGDGSTCDPIPCDPSGACCRPQQECVTRTRTACQTIGGFYLGDGAPCPMTSCAPNHNPGGVLLLHANPELVYTEGGDYCGDSGVVALEDVAATTPIGQTSLLHVLAAFPEEFEPSVSGAVFGIDYDASKLQISQWGSCGDWGYELGSWPAPQSGVYVRWDTSHTEHLFEVYWLAAYANEPTTLRLIRHLAEGGDFLGPPEEPTPDPIACFGAMGFGEPGVVCVPQLAAGACCISDSQCVFLSASVCSDSGGQFLGYDKPCVPLPCAASTVPGFDTTPGTSLVLTGPNPVQHELRFQLNAERSGPAVVRLLGVGGNVIATLFNGQLEPGWRELTWTPTGNTMRGVYWIDARLGGEQEIRKLILMP